eukprot:6208012-Amphidinium_carterae.1
MAANRHQLRAEASDFLVDKRALQRLIHQRDSLVPKVKKYLERIGEWEVLPRGAEGEGGGSKEASKAKLRAVKTELKDGCAETAPEPASTATTAAAAAINKTSGKKIREEVMGSTVIHRNFHTWSSVPAAHIRWLMSQLAPAALSNANIRATFKSNSQREMARELCNELVWCVVGIDPNTPVGSTRELQKILERLQTVHESRHRIGDGITLVPLNWALSGVYKLSMVGEVSYIEDRSKNVTKVLKHRALRGCDFKELFISQNFSNQLATILSTRDDGVSVKCCNFFFELDQTLSPSPKKRVFEKGSTEKSGPLPAVSESDVQQKRLRLVSKQKTLTEQAGVRDADAEEANSVGRHCQSME